jgi:arylsulfatase
VSRVFEVWGGKSKPPNILIITVDALRADHLDVYGYDRETAPELAALAKRGARFDAAYAQAPLTVPSIFMMMTGELFYRRSVPAGVPTLAERLKAEGYATAAFVRNPLIELDSCGMDRGFDTFFKPARVIGEDASVAELQLYEADLTAKQILAKADEWLRANHDKEPFFLWVHLFDPHDPYSPPEPYDTQFDPGYKGTADGDIRRTKDSDNPVWGLVEKIRRLKIRSISSRSMTAKSATPRLK